MPWSELLCGWLVDSALLSFVLLALGSGATLLCREPARRLRMIQLTLAGCLVAPWLGMIPGYPRLAIGSQPTAPPERETFSVTPAAEPAVVPLFSEPDVAKRLPPDLPPNTIAEPVESASRAWSVRAWILALYVLGVTIGVAWWLAGIAALVRILSSARAAPPPCRRLLAAIAGRRGNRVRLWTSRRAKQPFASAWWPVAIVLPESLCDDEQAVRWALAHEWSHVERHDFRAWFVAGLARVLFFYQPLVWWLRRQLRLCQDYVADARASREASQPEDYAAFLTVRAAAGSLHPAMVGIGMGFRKSELYRRVIMLVQKRSLEDRPPRLWTVFVTCAALLLVAAVAALTNAPQAAAQGAKPPGEDAVKEAGGSRKPGHAPQAEQEKGPPRREKTAKTMLTLESLGFVTTSSSGGPDNDEALDKLIKEKKYEFLNTFDSPNGEKQYVYRLIYPDGRRVGRNFSVPLEKVTSWADYRKKQAQQREQKNERLSQALTAGRFRLLNLEVLQVHICRDVASGANFKIQRIQRPDHTELAFPRPDYGKIPPAVKGTSWQEHLQAIREGKRELLQLETLNNYTYEMTADDGTKDIFTYGGPEPLDVLVKRAGGDSSQPGTAGKTSEKADAHGHFAPTSVARGPQGERVIGVRPRGNCSISGTVVAETTGKPIEHARILLHYNVTHGAIFLNTDSAGHFELKDIPQGPFSLRMLQTPGYQDASYDPEGVAGPFPSFSLHDGEHRAGIVLKAKPACRISGTVRDENGKIPQDVRTLSVWVWFKSDDGNRYELAQSPDTNADGSYVVDGLSDKPVYVMALNWRAAQEGHAYPPVYYPGTFSRSDAKLITFDKAPRVEGIDITLRKKGGLIIEGTVRDEAGKPIPEAFVVVHHRDMLFDCDTAYTDAQGHYQIQGLGEGQFLLHVDAIHRGFVRTRSPVDLQKTDAKVQRDVTLHRGVLLSGRLVDGKGNAWQIGESFGRAHVVDDRFGEDHESSFGLFWNKYRPKDTGSQGSTFSTGEGDYEDGAMLFPTKSTFIMQGMKPGHTLITFLPNKEGQKVLKILHDGHDILTSGMDTKAGQEIKDIAVVIGAP